ncbi:uncharacterized protein F4822DRAFT_128590 [Hypoxylon trugodes]|uniref:uncharacterized protein n=1 Tax=Hypoxylon trugodes TaxID=326681 RepID=UPI00218E9DFE|nr:uncharacterized protein F4822DRAFT_128590 [Hypoxylon trugodes]KAI1392405.1 hypothetical protein F4822DRAFT_128590 [Hypoxylon trugodes]
MPPRRTHRKSRAGCSECKSRHIKCDETRPACRNCSISWRNCSFLLSQPKLPIGRDAVQSDASPASQQSSETSPSCTIQEANMTQLELFRHAVIKGDFDLPPAPEESVRMAPPSVAIETAMSYPFLMNEVLAFAALHLSHIKPEKAQFYKHHAVGLQTHALGIFNREMTKVTGENCMAILIFTWFMTLHTIFETTESKDIYGFLDRLIHSMQLHRGVRAVTAEAWHMMLDSDMGYVLREATKLLDYVDSGIHTDELKNFILGSTTLKDDEKTVCKCGLERIQWFLKRTDGGKKQDPSRSTMFVSMMSWPVMIDADFLRLISERVPEALLVLAYYAIPLHLCRDIWVIGEAGQLLIQSVRMHLDEKWHKWLDWPEEIMNNSI